MSELEPTRTYSNPTANDILRRMLDERGVEWWQSANTLGCIFTRWHSPIFGDEVVAMENGEEGLVLFDHFVTPEQAIAATLGTGTCRLEGFADVPFSVDYEIEGYDMDSGRDYATLAECSACGAYILVPPEYHHVLTCDGDEVYQPYRFCPCCGKKVVEPTTNDVDAEATNG